VRHAGGIVRPRSEGGLSQSFCAFGCASSETHFRLNWYDASKEFDSAGHALQGADLRGSSRHLTLEPLRAAPLLIQIHAVAAIGAFALGIFQLAARKGTSRHRLTGWIWVGLMATVVLTSAGIHEMRVWGPWSPIHLLSVFTAVMLPMGVVHARRHRVRQHRASMIGLFCGAPIVAGIFILRSGRIMHEVVFGP
jgi:uncharacterized membrane protein